MKPKTVLVVDDNIDNRTIFRVVLAHAGYRVAEAENGRIGLDHVAKEKPDAIVLDLMMPVLGGWDMNRALKADPELEDIPVIVVTAHGSEVPREQIEEAAVSDFLEKPVPPRVLVDVVHRHIGPPPATDAA